MTTLEIFLSITLYFIVGVFICTKREFYTSMADSPIEGFFINFVACVCMPINLIIVFFKEFVLRKWNNY